MREEDLFLTPTPLIAPKDEGEKLVPLLPPDHEIDVNRVDAICTKLMNLTMWIEGPKRKPLHIRDDLLPIVRECHFILNRVFWHMKFQAEDEAK